MAIRITHGKVETIARFGIEAGKGEQRVRQAAEAAQTGRQQAAISAQAQASALRTQADITKTILNAQSRQEAMQFESFMQGESAKRAIAWQQEKTELSNLHDFEMLEQRKEIENQLSIESDGRQRSKLEAKMSALDAAFEQGQISEKQLADEKLRLELGIPGSQSPLFGKKDEASIFTDILAERKEEAAVVTPEQTNATELSKFVTATTTNTETRKDLKKILAKGDPVEIKVTLDTMEARKELEATTTSFREALGSITGGLSPTMKEKRQRKIFDLTKKAGLSTEGIVRPRTTTFAPSFSSFKQTSGSFR